MALGTEIRAVARKIAQAGRAAATAQSSSQGFRYGTVTSTELGVAQVVVDGNDGPTPCHATAATVSAGDRVAIRIDANGHGEILRNFTDPAASSSSVAEVGGVAAEAAAVAAATGQHFWDDDNGVHVTQSGRDDYEEAASGPNLLANSLGILLRMAANNLLSITSSAVAFYDGAGNADANTTAEFGATSARVGKSASGHVEVTSTGMEVFGYLSSTLKSLALFGSTVRIGPSDGPHLSIYTNTGDSDGNNNIYLDGYNGSSQIFRLRAVLHNGLRDVVLMGSSASTASIAISSGMVNITHGSKTVQLMNGNASFPGNILASGSLTAGGHSSAIGTIVESSGNDSDVTVPTATDKNLCSISLAAGTWLIKCGATFANNSTGRRRINLHTSSASSSSQWIRHTGTNANAVSGAATFLEGAHVVSISSSTTFYLVASQTSGGNLTCQGYLRAVRIA